MYLLTPKTKYGSAKELQFPCTCAGEPATYTMDSVHAAGPVYPFSGKYARKILRLDQSHPVSPLTPCRPLYLHGVLFSHEKGRDTMKRTYEKDLRGQYLLNAMEELTMNGDAYVSSDQLYRFARRSHKALTYD